MNLYANPRNNSVTETWRHTLPLSYRYHGSEHVWTMWFTCNEDRDAYKNIFQLFVRFE